MANWLAISFIVEKQGWRSGGETKKKEEILHFSSHAVFANLLPKFINLLLAEVPLTCSG